jgi:hypothetical protein
MSATAAGSLAARRRAGGGPLPVLDPQLPPALRGQQVGRCPEMVAVKAPQADMRDRAAGARQ